MTKSIRIWVAVNWTSGSLLLLLTVLAPIYFEHVHLKEQQATANRTVEAIAAFQRDELVRRKRYVTFGPTPGKVPSGLASLGLNDPIRHAFRYEAHFRPGGNLEIRALSHPSATREKWIPPLEYRYEMTALGAEASSGWLPRTNGRFGLLSLF